MLKFQRNCSISLTYLYKYTYFYTRLPAVNPKERLTAEYVMRSRDSARPRRHEGASSTRLHSPPIPRSHCHPNISTKLHFPRISKPIFSQWPLSRIVPSTPLPSSTRRFVPVPVPVPILCAFAGEAPAAAFPRLPVSCSS